MSDREKPKNMLITLPTDLSKEVTEILCSGKNVRIERIISKGQVSEAGFWYDQSESEWVMLVSGEAIVEFENPARKVSLKSGDYVLILPNERHRVDWTDPEKETIWLAVFY